MLKTVVKTKLFAPFIVNSSSYGLQLNVNICRIIFGLGLLHRYTDIFGFSFLSGINAEHTRLISLIGIVLGGMVTMGLFTPVALLCLNIFFFNKL